MYFDVSRCPRHIPRTLIDAAVMFSYAYHNIPEELGMEVEFTKKDDEFIGSCEYDDEERMAFVFVYRALYPSSSVKTIFHEITHIWQRLNKRLFVSEDYSLKEWDGVEYSYKDLNQDAYNDLPWERDANMHEELMFIKFQEAYPEFVEYLDDDYFDRLEK